MPQTLKKLTPNLVVSDVQRSISFYCDVLGFTKTMNVPDEPPYAFAAVQSGDIEIFLNSAESAGEEYHAFKDRQPGGTLTLFVEVADVAGLYASLKSKVRVILPLENKWYGVTEFAFEDPDGWLLTYAQR